MLDRRRGTQEGKDPGDQEYHRALTTFYQQVQSIMADVDDIANNLSSAYPQEALSHVSRHFEGISREFTSYTIAANRQVNQKQRTLPERPLFSSLPH